MDPTMIIGITRFIPGSVAATIAAITPRIAPAQRAPGEAEADSAEAAVLVDLVEEAPAKVLIAVPVQTAVQVQTAAPVQIVAVPAGVGDRPI